jgi:hypothetical protein
MCGGGGGGEGMQEKSTGMGKKARTVLQKKCALVSFRSCKDQTSWCNEQFGRPLMKFYLDK